MAVVTRLMVLFPQFLASPVEDLADLELEMAELINAEREARGIPPLARNSELTAVTRADGHRGKRESRAGSAGGGADQGRAPQ